MKTDPIYLTQSDTTVGIFSKDYKKLNAVKKRDINKPCLMSVSSLNKLKNQTRVPQKYKKMIRRASKSTFLYKNKKAIRVSMDSRHNLFLDKFDYLYSTSANFHNHSFNLRDIEPFVDIVINDSLFEEKKASSMYKINNINIKRIR